MSIITGDGRIPELILPEYTCCEEISEYNEMGAHLTPLTPFLFSCNNKAELVQRCTEAALEIGFSIKL